MNFGLLLQDAKNYLQAQIAVRFRPMYLPTLFGHFGVNTICNLRCSYCYIHEKELYPSGFTETGLPLEEAKRVLEHLREECLSVRLQGGEPLLYRHIIELARYAKEELRFRNVSLITNGIPFAKNPRKYEPILNSLDLLTLSIDETRFKEYPSEMEELMTFLPTLKDMCQKYKVGITSNYTAAWEELAHPERIVKAILRWQKYIPYYYVMPVRIQRRTPLDLRKNSQKLNRKYSLGFYEGPKYPERENVEWYQRECIAKLKVKINAKGDLLYPCENYSTSLGSLIDHSLKELWPRKKRFVPDERCLECGKQRCRLKAFKRIDHQALFFLKKRFHKLDWASTARESA